MTQETVEKRRDSGHCGRNDKLSYKGVMTVFESLANRRAVPSFDPTQKIERAELMTIMNQACLAPSSQNLQPWEFLICETDEEKALLSSVSFNQTKILEASAVILLLGNLRQYEHAERVGRRNVELGYFDEDRLAKFIESTRRRAEADPQSARDEAFRGSSLWAMAFMLAAMDRGWDTAPMGGYSPADLVSAFGVPETYVPTLIICIGKRNPEVILKDRALRFSAEERSHFGKF